MNGLVIILGIILLVGLLYREKKKNRQPTSLSQVYWNL